MRPVLVLTAVAMCSIPAGAQGHGQNFFFFEESHNLPVDTTLPGTSSADVALWTPMVTGIST